MAVWYVMRASGAMTMVLLSAVLALGIATTNRRQLGRLPRFATLALHRNVSLLAVVFLTIHVATSLIDPYAQVSAASVVVPFVGAGRPLWIGLGAVSLDLVAALTVTSMLRRHLSQRVWKGVHWLAYLSWPVALVHGLGVGSDTGTVWLRALTAGCVVVVGSAVVSRLRAVEGPGKRLERRADAPPQRLAAPTPLPRRLAEDRAAA
jgi:sulfoxide reductase heme-binding subunit YedZ